MEGEEEGHEGHWALGEQWEPKEWERLVEPELGAEN